ncbi:MAG: peptidylprolyl isomerase [Proteobacteria bacterium]|nr:peptidylprolyl isomerase [Pseudomonadota bacterium]
MQIKNRFLIFLVFCFFACSNGGETIITVGKKTVTDKELLNLYAKYKESVDIKTISKASFISQLIERLILEEEAKKMGIVITEDEINAFLKENNIDEKKKDMVKHYLLRDKISHKLVEDIKIDEALINEIERNLLDVQPEKYIFYQIVLNSKEEAIKALEEIRGGLDFNKAVEKYSTLPEKTRGGIVDYLNADELPVELLNQLRKMKKGEISSIISSPFGFHIIKLKEYIPKGQIDKGDKRKRAIEEAKKVMQGNVYADWIAKKKKEYGVNIKWELVEKIN